MEVLESLFAKALKLESPWKITKIEFHEGGGIIKVFVDFPRGSVSPCPACGKEVKAYGHHRERMEASQFLPICLLPGGAGSGN